MGKSTDFKFGWYIHRVHPNKSPLKILEKGSVGVSRDCPKFLSAPIISGTGNATNFKILYAHSWDRSEQKPIKNFGKSIRGLSQELSKIFMAPIYTAHRSVIFAIAQLSCFIFGCWLLPEKFSFCPKNNGFARVCRSAAPSPLARTRTCSARFAVGKHHNNRSAN